MKQTLTVEQRLANALAMMPDPERLPCGETRNEVIRAIAALRGALAATAHQRID